MKPKERMLTALTGGRPDRLPISVHQWQGFHLQTYLGGISALEAFARFGMDASIQYEQFMGGFWLPAEEFARLSTPEWRDEVQVISTDPDRRILHHTVTTPAGKLHYKTAGNRQTTWVTEYPLKHDEDLAALRYLPVQSLDLAAVSRARDEVGDRGILRGGVWGDQAGCWQHACCLMESTALILRCFDTPDWVHELLGILLEKKLRYIETMARAPFDLVETGGGAASSTLISPKLHREFCLPYDRQMHEALQAHGLLVAYHTCGGTRGIEEAIVENGCDVSETLSPISMGSNQEPGEFAATIAGRVALIGGIDQFNVLTGGTPELIRMKVRELFETVGPNGGYVLSPADHFYAVPPANLTTFADAARECSYT